ncbi:hypothetical protein BWQ96_05710 [Gracilariopsis chorda]|uniref:Uncharacterized protein n=1 Tax=Gracilariopsis chorda TaxID=448386 RepID=A0A2V3IQY9_9FLOR|nr:hypothetical protein BWQ96_05710 [Gracilariopsis chorda]|eukprot:PXF44532.1 hypothetical protein BWQ96_05710 [Gracilariopsis chorda]
MPKQAIPLTGPHMPHKCSPNPVRVIEFPLSEELITSSQLEEIESWVRVNARQDFEAINIDADSGAADFTKQFSVALGSKIGGFEYYTQYAGEAKCPNCGTKMSHLLTIASSEYTENDAKRWHPYDRHGNALLLNYDECSGICIGDLDEYFAHVCLRCEERPIVFQSPTR